MVGYGLLIGHSNSAILPSWIKCNILVHNLIGIEQAELAAFYFFTKLAIELIG